MLCDLPNCMIITSICTCWLCRGKSGMTANINASCKMSWDRRRDVRKSWWLCVVSSSVTQLVVHPKKRIENPCLQLKSIPFWAISHAVALRSLAPPWQTSWDLDFGSTWYILRFWDLRISECLSCEAHRNGFWWARSLEGIRRRSKATLLWWLSKNMLPLPCFYSRWMNDTKMSSQSWSVNLFSMTLST